MDPADVTFLSNGWVPVVRVVFIAVTGYLTLLVLLRVTGQRTLAQMSALDLIITVTIGSAFGRVLTARDVALIEVIAAFATLVALEWLVAWAWLHPRVRTAISVKPALLYHDGEFDGRAMRRHRLREEDLHTAARQQGMGSLEDARAVLLEANGSFSVLQSSQYGDGVAVRSVIEQRRRD